MALIRCTSCAYANAADAKVCAKCGSQLRVPPHLMRCPYCGSLNQLKATVCMRCERKLVGSWWRRLRGRRAWAVIATSAALVAILGYYGYAAYPRSLPREAPQPTAVAPVTAEPPPVATDSPRTAVRPPGDTPKAKAPPVAVAREASAPREAGEPRAPGAERCDEGVAALGLCGKTQVRQPARTQGCTEAAAALGLCDSGNTKGRE